MLLQVEKELDRGVALSVLLNIRTVAIDTSKWNQSLRSLNSPS